MQNTTYQTYGINRKKRYAYINQQQPQKSYFGQTDR